MQKICLTCNERPARVLPKGRVVFRNREHGAVFCSLRCAAEYALRAVAGFADGAAAWCDQHGWETNIFAGDPECADCWHDAHEE